ncbi:VOC family protein [Streptomyces sp. NPDC101151]|uniref:VOC family protein n=1 Tax=Streptomyces sp. NPDC101151 TaxID=3366115 RepID=UPI00382C4912
MLTVLPIRYVADVEASRRFYEGLGLAYRRDVSVPVWAHLDAAAGAVGVHDAAASKGRLPGTVELGFTTGQRLEDVSAQLTERGYEHTLFDEDFGRSIRVTDPDGVVIQIQEIDPDTVRRSQSRL